MSSVHSRPSQTNAIYINIAPIQSSIIDENLAKVSWVTGLGALSIPGAAVLRDMGKTVYVPDLATGAVPSTILRSVQYIPQGATTATTTPPFYTGYIRIGAVDGFPSGVARIQ
jgi:hypothetical protein